MYLLKSVDVVVAYFYRLNMLSKHTAFGICNNFFKVKQILGLGCNAKHAQYFFIFVQSCNWKGISLLFMISIF